jgi:hypothetical protein
MLTIILGTLKIIGIIILFFILLLILLLGLLLFVPIRYRVKAEYNQKAVGEFYIHWLLSIISIKGNYKESFYYIVRVFGWKIVDSRKEKKVVSKNKKTKQNKIMDIEKSENKESKIEISQELEPNNAPKNLEELKLEDSSSDKPKRFFLAKVWRKIKETIWNIRFKFKAICVRIKKFKGKIRYYLDILEEDNTKEALQLSKNQLLRILKHIKPQKLKIYVEYGDESVEQTARVMALWGMMYPIFLDHIIVIPFFEESKLYVKAYLKGRITLFVLVCVMIRIYFNKNIRVLLERLKREV